MKRKLKSFLVIVAFVTSVYYACTTKPMYYGYNYSHQDVVIPSK